MLNRSESQTQNSPAPGPSQSPPTDPIAASSCFAARALHRTKQPGSAAGEGAPQEGSAGARTLQGAALPGGTTQPIASPFSPEPLLSWLDPSPGTPSPAVWWWESSRVLCVGWRPSSRGPGPRRGAAWGQEEMLGAAQGCSGWERGGGRTWQTSVVFHVSNCN